MISNNDRSGWFGASDTDKVIARNRNTKTWKSWWSVKLGEQEPDFQGSKYTEAGNKYEHHILREINDKMERTDRYAAYIDKHLVQMEDIRKTIEKQTGIKIMGW